MDERDVDEAECRGEPRGEASAVDGVDASKSEVDAVIVLLNKGFLEEEKLAAVVEAILDSLSGKWLEAGEGGRERGSGVEWDRRENDSFSPTAQRRIVSLQCCQTVAYRAN
jgi:hypothetical protein